ncbi:MAG: SufD family Fe-S cluster assembly protein [Oscillospiraceae bacterium]|nr:SufD family Fe-S cluster assembly protein [Oscillospiraceae bacterium]
MEQLKLNRLPVPTFGRLDVNRISAELAHPEYAEPEIALPGGVAAQEVPAEPAAVSEASQPLADFLADQQIPCRVISGSADEAVRIRCENSGAARLRIEVPAGGHMTVITHFAAEYTAMLTEIQAADDAQLHLIQIVSGRQTLNEISAALADRAQLSLTQIYAGGSHISGITAQLDGDSAAFDAGLGYLLDGTDQLDLSLNAVHLGRQSTSDMEVRGVLRDSAQKTFRGTIDFRRGASGAKGAEREDVLLMNPTVRNKTVPLILCAEEDVDGTHGASIGRIDDRHVFYLQSRGIPKERIYEIMAQSKLNSIVSRIKDSETEQEINRLLHKEDANA